MIDLSIRYCLCKEVGVKLSLVSAVFALFVSRLFDCSQQILILQKHYCCAQLTSTFTWTTTAANYHNHITIMTTSLI